MKKLGRLQQLEVLRFTSVGAYINDVDETSDSDVLLPKKYLSEDIALGDFVEVFLYKDAQNRLIATTQKPLLEVGQIGALKVESLTEHGAFLKWGIDKDLFLPFREQVGDLKKGDAVTVIVYVDNMERLCASMRIEKFLSVDHGYNAGDQVSGTVYKHHPEIGAFVAVEGKYYGLIPQKDCFKIFAVGEAVSLRIARVHPDGKLVLSTRQSGATQLFIDVDSVLQALNARGGSLPFDDKADPALINRELNMSKKAFKRAVGVLLKDKKIAINAGSIALIEE